MSWMTGYQKKVKQLFSHNQWSDCVPVLDYIHEHKIFICEGPYIGFTFICQPTPGCNDDIRNTLTNLYNQDWPKDSLMQVSLVSLPDINDHLIGFNTIRGQRMPENDGHLSDSMSSSVINHMKKSTVQPIHKSGLKVRNFECWISFKMPIKKQIPSKDELKKALKLFDDIENALNAVNLLPSPMTDEDWLHRMNILINQSPNAVWRDNRIKRNHGKSLRSQILEPGGMVKTTEQGIELFSEGKEDPDTVISMLSLKRYPDYIAYGQMLDLVGDWREGLDGVYDNFMITLNIHFPDQFSEKKAFEKRRGWLTHQARGKLLEWVDSLAYQKQDYDAVNHELNEKGAKLCKAFLQFTLFSDSRPAAEKAVAKMKALYAKRKFFLVEDRYFCAPLFLTSLPLGMDGNAIGHFHRFDTFTSHSLVYLTPHMSSWKGNTNTPVMSLIGRDGQIFSLDLFKTDSNYNAMISAASGSGKSFFINGLVSSYLGSGIKIGGSVNQQLRNPPNDGAQVFIVDVGRSYEGLCAQYEGSQFLEFGVGMKYSLNPFPNIHDWHGKEGQAQMVLNLVKAMASESGKISDYQSAEMLNLLTEMWEEEGQAGTITKFARKCAEHEHEHVRRIAAQLKPFSNGGVYADFFGDNLPPVQFDGRLIVCELEELKAIPHVQQCVLMAIINNAQHAFYLSGADRNKLFILDEAWEYLSGGQGNNQSFAKFLETGWRRFRKTRAAGICVTQSMLDAYQSAAGIAMVNNSAWKIMLRQEPETIEKLREQKAFDGTELDFQLLKSVRTRKGEYSELFIRLGAAREIVRFFVDSKSQLVYSTDPKDKSDIGAYRQAGYTLPEAINAVHKDRYGATT